MIMVMAITTVIRRTMARKRWNRIKKKEEGQGGKGTITICENGREKERKGKGK